MFFLFMNEINIIVIKCSDDEWNKFVPNLFYIIFCTFYFRYLFFMPFITSLNKSYDVINYCYSQEQYINILCVFSVIKV